MWSSSPPQTSLLLIKQLKKSPTYFTPYHLLYHFRSLGLLRKHNTTLRTEKATQEKGLQCYFLEYKFIYIVFKHPFLMNKLLYVNTAKRYSTQANDASAHKKLCISFSLTSTLEDLCWWLAVLCVVLLKLTMVVSTNPCLVRRPYLGKSWLLRNPRPRAQ